MSPDDFLVICVMIIFFICISNFLFYRMIYQKRSNKRITNRQILSKVCNGHSLTNDEMKRLRAILLNSKPTSKPAFNYKEQRLVPFVDDRWRQQNYPTGDR